MTNCIAITLHRSQHNHLSKPQHTSHKHTPIHFGTTIQMTSTDTLLPLTMDKIKQVWEIVGTLLYYSQAIDSTMAATIGFSIAAHQSCRTEDVLAASHQLLDCAATHFTATIQYLASDVILAVHSDASYLSKYNSKSRTAGHYYLTKAHNETFNNREIISLSTIIKHVVALASDSELAALFYNGKQTILLWVTYTEMRHWQPDTHVTNDSAVHGLITKSINPKAVKAMDSNSIS